MTKQVVLIVEDEPLLRMHAAALIEDAGFDTLEARSADQAMDILRERLDVRVVFTDIDLPGGMDGLRLAAVIRDRWPPIDLILTSGHIQVSGQDVPERGHFLAKPYGARQLICAIRRMVH